MPESRITLDEWYRLENERALERARRRPEFNEAVSGEYRSRGGTAGWDECERIVLGWTVADNAELPSLVHVKPERPYCEDAVPSAAHGCTTVGQYEFKEGFVDKVTLVFRPKRGFEDFPYADGFVDYPMGVGRAGNGVGGVSVKAGGGISYGRIGAAWKRECEATAEQSSAVGNAAAMREALEKLRTETERFYNNEWIPYDAWQGCDDMISHALSAPARNCDVGTADEQGERFKAFCRNHQFVSADSEDGFPPVYVCSNESCPLHDYYIAHGEDDCEIAWAQMPYDSEAAK